MSLRPSDITVSERLIQLRKDGPEKVMRKRPPAGRSVLSASELSIEKRYRTPMDDSGHLWAEGTRFFRCGRYAEYPWYYEEGWHMFLGERYVKVDTRKGGACALCNQAVKDEKDTERWHNELVRVGEKYGVEQKWPQGSKRRGGAVPPAYTKWIGTKARKMYVPSSS